MFEIESRLYFEGHTTLACIDEVGRGCLFGDVVACALVLPPRFTIEGVKDSKKLSAKKREELYDYILHYALAVGIGRIDSTVIDRINIRQATRLAMKNALINMADKDGKPISPSYVLIDAETIDVDIQQMGIIDGDNIVHGISAASIVAKVFRDRLCIDWNTEYPQYGLAENKGYGTSRHFDALRLNGPTPLHRKSFITKILEGNR